MSATPPGIEVRDLRFDLSAVPKYWLNGKRGVSIYFNNLSTLFPPGERFFVTSVKAYRKRVTDPKLQGQMDAFCAQEGHHSREHARYNQWMAEQGYPAPSLEKVAERILRRTTKFLPRRVHLATTCALEHFTSLMGTLVLSDDRVLKGAHPQMAALWRWHSAEENEHKAVAFDVYRAVNGPYWERAGVMLLTTIIFWWVVLFHQARLMKTDGLLFSGREWLAFIRDIFFSPWGLHRLLRPYLQYYRPSFHPNQHDTRALIDGWRAGQLARSG